MFKAVIFDLDNTLIDFLKMKRFSCDAAISAMIDAGLQHDKNHVMKKLYKLYDEHGMEERQIFQFLLKDLKGDIDPKVLAAGIVAYRRVKIGFLEPYPHVVSSLLKMKLNGLKLVIVTDAPRMKAWIRLTSMKIADYFDIVVTYDDTLQHKPSKVPFETALKKLKLKPADCLMVGDWPDRDIKGAKQLGMKSCFAKYGNPHVKISGADYEVESFEALLDILKIS